MSDVWHSDSTEESPHHGEARRFRRLRRHHWAMLRLSAFVLAMALLLEVRPDQLVQFRGGPGWAFPESCGSKLLLQQECPACGLTRGFIWIARGQIDIAWQLNRMSVALAWVGLAQFPYRAWALYDLHNRQRLGQPPPTRRWPVWLGWSLLIGLMMSWVLKRFGI